MNNTAYSEKKKAQMVTQLWIFCANMLNVYTEKKGKLSDHDWEGLIHAVDQNSKPFIQAGLKDVYSATVMDMLDRIEKIKKEENLA